MMVKKNTYLRSLSSNNPSQVSMQKSDFKNNAGEFKKSYLRNCFIWFHRKHAKRFQIKVIMHARKPFSNQLE